MSDFPQLQLDGSLAREGKKREVKLKNWKALSYSWPCYSDSCSLYLPSPLEQAVSWQKDAALLPHLSTNRVWTLPAVPTAHSLYAGQGSVFLLATGIFQAYHLGLPNEEVSPVSYLGLISCDRSPMCSPTKFTSPRAGTRLVCCTVFLP